MTSSQTDRLPVPTPVRKFTGPTTTCQLFTSDSWGYVEINAGSVAITCILPPTGGPYTIFDGAGVAAAHNITIKDAGGTTISTITANGNMSVCAYDGTAMVAILSNAGAGITTGANNTFTGTNDFNSTVTFHAATYLTSFNYGGTTSGATLNFYSTSGAGTSDAIRFYTGSQVLALTIDTHGRLIEAIGSAGTWSGHNRLDPFDIPGQPAPVDGRIGMIVNYADNTSGSLAIMNLTNYTSGTRYAACANFTGIALTNGSATWGFNALAIAAISGASAQGAQIEADAYASGVVAIALTLSVGGDSANPTTGFLEFVSNAAGNSASYLMQANASSINPLQTTGSIFNVAGSNLHCTYGFDLSNVTISQAAWRSSGVTIDGSGVFLINTGVQQFSVTERISVGGGAVSVAQGNSTTAALYVGNQKTGGVTNISVEAWNGSAWNGVGAVTNDGTNTAFATSSDYRLKVTFGTFDPTPIRGTVTVHLGEFKTQPGVRRAMFLAHELQLAGFGFAVHGEKDALAFDDNGDPIMVTDADGNRVQKIIPQMVDPSMLVPTLWAKEEQTYDRTVALEAENAELRALITALTEQVTALAGRITTLETPH